MAEIRVSEFPQTMTLEEFYGGDSRAAKNRRIGVIVSRLSCTEMRPGGQRVNKPSTSCCWARRARSQPMWPNILKSVSYVFNILCRTTVQTCGFCQAATGGLRVNGRFP